MSVRLLFTYQRSVLLSVLLTAFLMTGLSMDVRAQNRLRAQQNLRPPELNVQFHRAETAWKSGNSLLEAKARIDRVIQALPEDQEARKLRAGIFLSMAQPERALIDARQAVRLGPNDGEALLLVCEAASRTNRTGMALDALQRAADHLLDQPGLHIRLSRCALALERLDEAEAFARIALAGDAKDVAAYVQLARVFVIARQFQKSITVLEKGLRLGLIRMDQIRNDPDLRQVADDPAFAAYRRPR